MEIFNEYLSMLLQLFKYDVEALSQPWMYYWLLVPAIAYTVFFFAKWAVLTAPIWLPLMLIVSACGRRCGGEKRKD